MELYDDSEVPLKVTSCHFRVSISTIISRLGEAPSKETQSYRMRCKKSSAFITASNPLIPGDKIFALKRAFQPCVYLWGKTRFLRAWDRKDDKKAVKMAIFRLGDSNFVEFELIFWLANSRCI